MVKSYLLTVHHDGCFFYDPLRYEHGSKIDINVSRVCYEEMVAFLERDTSSIVSALYWCLPDNELETGLLKIDNDNDLDTLFDISDSYGHVNIYIDHFGDDFSGYINNKVEGKNDETEKFMEEGNLNVEEKITLETEKGMEQENLNTEEEKTFESVLGIEQVNVNAETYSDDEVDIESDDNSDAKSLDHLSDGEEELVNVRTKKANSKMVPPPKKLPKLGVGLENIGTNHEDFLMTEHDEFIEELLKVLKTDEDVINEDPAHGQSDNENESDKYPIYDPSTHWKLKKPIVGERYESPKQFKECITYYALANGYSIWFDVCSKKKMIARCGIRGARISDPTKGKQKKTKRYPQSGKTENVEKDETNGKVDCPWRCYARWMRKEASFQVISLKDVHTCSRSFKYGSLINYKWIGKEFGSKIRLNPDMKLVELADLVLKKYKCIISPNQCRKAKMWAINVYEKSLVEHYGMLRAYGDELLRSNPGSTVNLGVTTNPDELVYFDRFYVCLSALKEAWKKGCRRIIAIDGCFLKGVCQGELLSAIGRDGNNHIFPIAWAVVNVENKDNWEWFIRLLGQDIDIPDGQGLTLMSDQHKGLLEAVKEVMPYAEHRQCARHIYENFRKHYSGVEFRNLFWQASKASYPLEFERVMKEIKASNRGAYDYLMHKEPKTWSRAFFELNSCCEAVENGFSECFNSILVKVRSKPIITMLEAIRVILMERMARMRKISDSWNFDICPTIIKKLENAKASQRYWNVLPRGGSRFEVRQGHDAFTVDEENRTCTCRMWQLSGIPCPHAVAAIFYIHKLPDEYVPHWFRKDLYKETYSYHLQPVHGMNQWPPNSLNKPLPPKPRIMPGRPRRKRKRAAHEPASHVAKISRVGGVITCNKCGIQGHNQRGCKEVGRQNPPKPRVNKKKPSVKPTVNKEKGNSPTVDKGKGILIETSKKKHGEATDNQSNVGGFMSDARRSYIPPRQSPRQSTRQSTQQPSRRSTRQSTQQPSTSKEKVKENKKQKLVPIRKQGAQHRLNILNLKRKIPGPGNSSNDPKVVD